jgi:hypothetical protein
MDTKQLESVVLTELHDKHGLDSLKIQNHIYGCFIIMEDIAESNVTMNGSILSIEGYSFDISDQFSEIGIRYGFLMDTHLDWVSSDSYKAAWMNCFKKIQESHDIQWVETIEDVLISFLKEHVKPQDAFILHALEHGVLPREQQDKVIKLLKGGSTKTDHVEPVESAEPAEEKHPMLAQAHVDTPMHPTQHTKEKRHDLHKTRRHRKKEILPTKKSVSTTRRATRV